MNTNGILRKHWVHISVHFGLDSALFYLSLLIAALVRFGGDFYALFVSHGPAIIVSALVCSAATYIFGLYSTHSANAGIMKRATVLGACILAGASLLVGLTYLQSSRPLGRGVIFLGGSLSYLLVLIHHMCLLHKLRTTRERVAYVVGSKFDEMEIRVFHSLGSTHLELVGVVEHDGYEASGPTRVLGKTGDLLQIVRREKISRVLCTDKSLKEAGLCQEICRLRYSGVTVMPLISLCEETDQYVPLELITSEWLLTASGEPHLLYIKKVKRLFDIVASMAALILAAPVLLLAMLAVKLSSPGPVFYHQTRSGRFGRSFRIVKLRTMNVDAEKNGIAWCNGAADPRVTPVGRFLRKYRIDEIPQLLHVLAGDMSFVGPRPERPEIIETLGREIPHYHERLLIQPGITGWAQVSYPYGASVEDARRKLEYDLYYMKQMSVFLDGFILLDTVRTVLCGGARDLRHCTAERQDAMLAWGQMKLESAAAIPATVAYGLQKAA